MHQREHMPFRNWPTWLKIVSALLPALVLGWGMWMALRDTLCSVETRDWVLKRPTRGACLEFWLFRYQSAWAGMLGAAAALIAALIAWRAVQRQLNYAHQQAEKQSNLRAYKELGDLASNCSQIVADIHNLDTPMGRSHADLPNLDCGSAFDVLAPLSFEDTTDLFQLAKTIEEANQADFDWIESYGIPDGDHFIKCAASYVSLRARCLQDRFAKALGWQVESSYRWPLLVTHAAEFEAYLHRVELEQARKE
ncbi:hypothetical protein [Bosea sp. UC22_33]|uniref:hypothetical protein n=1 Tax=Bosea sp. UC22_33 TaxID=3350165 RepID=UPI0036725669